MASTSRGRLRSLRRTILAPPPTKVQLYAMLLLQELLVMASASGGGGGDTATPPAADGAPPPPPVGREVVSFNYGFRFKYGPSYGEYKPSGSATPNISTAPERLPGTPDASWQLLDVPHDMLIGGVMSAKGDRLESACLPRGDGWYRKHFRLPPEWRGRAVWLEFEGVWQRTTVFLNGLPLPVDRTPFFEVGTPLNPIDPEAWGGNGTGEFYTGHWEGYTGFTLRIDNASNVNFGSTENVLAVHVDALKGTGWW
jgi:hypothetical protein